MNNLEWISFKNYEDKGLGVDTSLDGLRLKYSPFTGLNVTSLI